MYLSCCLPLVCLCLEQMRFTLWYWGSIASSTTPLFPLWGLLGHALWACAMSPDFSGETLLSFIFKYLRLKVCISFLWVYSKKFWKPNIITKFNTEKNKLCIKNVFVFLKFHSVDSSLAADTQVTNAESSVSDICKGCLWITCLLPYHLPFSKNKPLTFLANICNICDIFINNMLVLQFSNFQI